MIKTIMLRMYNTIEVGALEMYVIIYHIIKLIKKYSFKAQLK